MGNVPAFQGAIRSAVASFEQGAESTMNFHSPAATCLPGSWRIKRARLACAQGNGNALSARDNRYNWRMAPRTLKEKAPLEYFGRGWSGRKVASGRSKIDLLEPNARKHRSTCRFQRRQDGNELGKICRGGASLASPHTR